MSDDPSRAAWLSQVTGQQLSVAATRQTLARIEALFGGHLPAPTELLAGDLEQQGTVKVHRR